MTSVLVVDDLDDNTYMLRVLLESQGYGVESARNGAEALEKARLAPPDLVVSDILMPVMDGFALCRRWRADERLRAIPFIFYTATYTDPKDERLAMELGADAFIVKPAETEDLLAAVLTVLARADAGRLAPRDAPVHDDVVLSEYSEALVRKLEDKMLELERVNQTLEREMAERTHAEEALRDSEARFRGLFETMSQGVVYQDGAGRIVLANPAAERMLGLSLDRIHGRTSLDPRWEAVHEDGSPFPADEQPPIVALRTGDMVTGVVMGIRRTQGGGYRWLSLDALPQLREGETLPSSVFTTFTDITERTRARTELDRQLAFDELIERLLSRIASASAAEIEGHVAATMEPIARFMGVDSAMVLQTSDDRSSWGATYGWAAPGIRSLARRLRNLPMGTLPWVEAELVAGRTVLLRSFEELPADVGQLRGLWKEQGLRSALMVPLRGRGALVRGCLGLFAVSRDVAWERQDVRHVEQAGEAIASALERKHVEDSLRASDEQLRQSQKMEAVGQLAGGIAHDFNNLLTAIRGYSELLNRGLPAGDAENRADLEQVILAADRAAALTRQLLLFGRRAMLQPEVVEPNEILASIVPMLRRLLGEHVELSTHAAPGVGRVKVDPSQFEQIIVNLAVNARDAMPDGGMLTFELSNAEYGPANPASHAEVTPGAYVVLAVSDTGTGMDADTRAHIFEPFFTTKEKGKGTGMGLATVYGIVKQSGGSIFLYSEPGQGTTFRIYLPRVADEATTNASDALPAGPAASGTETILLVEDDAAVRGFARRVLEDRGYRVLEASGGADALAIAEAGPGEAPIALLVTDVVMPGMQGHQLAAQLTTRLPGLRVLFVSGFTPNSVIHHGVAEQTVAFLPKPFSGDALASAVRGVLDDPAG